MGEYELALVALSHPSKFGVNSKVIALRGYIFARSGRTEESLDVINTLISISKERYLPPYAMAIVHAGLTQYDQAFHWLEQCYDVRDVHVIFLTIDPKWDPIRGDKRFSDLLSRCGFSQKFGSDRPSFLGRSI